ncbi:hypothetical protein FSARC_1131 [Fusarium sarcochroum]|uniref:Enoyl-CoA hydratase n=1 Tax=Fusarium sarcochroum TaxID=1208366 RepID=A0A8H4U9Z9_9HYPO|nr:hypothetical protein FSARC_1131 [Fusarium sarcochroum]
MCAKTTLGWKLIVEDEELGIYGNGLNRKVVLNRPRNGNALTASMVSRLQQFFLESANDNTISRIILTAKGKFFCTGMDLGKSTDDMSRDEHANSSKYRIFVDLFQAIQDSPKVTIAVINGPCYAGGIGLAFSCDIRLAVVSATVSLSEVKLGLCPAIISQYLVREWGTAFTREAMLSGRTISIADLKTIGAVHGIAKTVPDLENLQSSYLESLRFCASQASSMCKDMVRAANTSSIQDERDAAVRKVFVEMMKDGSESSIGIRNFQSKKKRVDWDELGPQSKL